MLSCVSFKDPVFSFNKDAKGDKKNTLLCSTDLLADKFVLIGVYHVYYIEQVIAKKCTLRGLLPLSGLGSRCNIIIYENTNKRL